MHNPVPGLGSYAARDKRFNGRLAHAVMSILAVTAVAISAGFETGRLLGSETHDEVAYDQSTSRFPPVTNRAGGLEGGM